MSLCIWHLCSNRWNSAITEYALSAARALALAGHRNIFTPLVDSPAATRAAPYLDTRPAPHFGLGALPLLVGMAREIAPDVIITYGGPETFLAKVLRRPTGARVVRFRGQALDASGVTFAARHRLAHGHVDLVLTPSEALAQEVRAATPALQVACVPLGCDTALYHRVPPPDGVRPELLLLGRLDPVKGHGVALGLLAQILAASPPAAAGRPRPRLRIVGEPANLSGAHIAELAKDAGLVLGEDVLLTTERVADVAALLSAAAVGIIPSLGSELICRVAEEFLLCGTPVAVSGVGSLEEVLYDDAAGFTWRGLDEAAASRRLGDWLWKSVEEGEAAKAKRAATAKAEFSLEAMGEGLNALLV